MVDREKIDRVLQKLDPARVEELTAGLVRLNTVFDPEAGTSEQPAAELVAEWAAQEGLDFRVEEVSPGRPNVIITLQGSPGLRSLMLEGHTDVVTPGDVTAWTVDPFSAKKVGRRMYGRGTNDTKGNLAAMLTAMAAIKRSGAAFQGTIVGGVLCDEEGDMSGVLDFIARGHADRITGAIVCEPQDGLICCTQKGALRAKFTILGRMCHGAMPLAGLGTYPALARLIDSLAALEREEMEAHGRDELLGWPSLTPTVIQAPAKGPGQLNVVPGEAVVLVDLRTIPAQSHPGLIAKLEGLAGRVEEEANRYFADYDRRIGLSRVHDLSVSVEILTDRPATLTDRSDPVVKAVDWAVREVTGREPVYAGVPGATDGTFLWDLKGIPIVTVGAGDREVPHQRDEWVDLDQLADWARIYALAALAYLSPEPGPGG